MLFYALWFYSLVILHIGNSLYLLILFHKGVKGINITEFVTEFEIDLSFFEKPILLIKTLFSYLLYNLTTIILLQWETPKGSIHGLFFYAEKKKFGNPGVVDKGNSFMAWAIWKGSLYVCYRFEN